jgi:hypothetical protein
LSLLLVTRHPLLFTDSYLLFIHQWIFNQDALDDLSVIQVFRDYFLRLQPKGSSNNQRIPKRELCTTNTLRHSRAGGNPEHIEFTGFRIKYGMTTGILQ